MPTSLTGLAICRRVPTLLLAWAWRTPTWFGSRAGMARLPRTLARRRLGASSCAGVTLRCAGCMAPGPRPPWLAMATCLSCCRA
eukprot:15276832-Alexandrium_andersonii.AAC.1